MKTRPNSKLICPVAPGQFQHHQQFCSYFFYFLLLCFLHRIYMNCLKTETFLLFQMEPPFFTWWVLLNWFLSSWFLSSCRPVVAGLAGPWVACTEEAATLVRAARVVVNVAEIGTGPFPIAVTTTETASVAVGVTLTGTCHKQAHEYWQTFTNFTSWSCMRCPIVNNEPRAIETPTKANASKAIAILMVDGRSWLWLINSWRGL